MIALGSLEVREVSILLRRVVTLLILSGFFRCLACSARMAFCSRISIADRTKLYWRLAFSWFFWSFSV